ncbi:hypothetical protein [Phocaeicola vulgatus]|uniref:hypothetical protein n=1 Tax=Phocaeicola vulgatus TaxID=821 RepID=UPI0020B2ABDA|nr:hypothetical protein [Phocaeicola vulgatus]
MTIHYTKGEEWANTLSHGVGILIGIAGGGYLLLTAMKSGNGSPDKPRGLSIQLCKSEKKEFYIRYSS